MTLQLESIHDKYWTIHEFQRLSIQPNLSYFRLHYIQHTNKKK